MLDAASALDRAVGDALDGEVGDALDAAVDGALDGEEAREQQASGVDPIPAAGYGKELQPGTKRLETTTEVCRGQEIQEFRYTCFALRCN